MKKKIFIKLIKYTINGQMWGMIYKKYIYKCYSDYIRKKKEIKLIDLNAPEFIYKTPFGFKLLINKNKIVEREFYLGNYESDILNIFRKLVKKNYTIIDAGANIGVFSLIAANKYKGKVRVYAFEPAAYPANKIRKNIEINRIETIEVCNSALGNYKGEINLNICEDDAYNSIGTNPQAKIQGNIKVPITTIDIFCKENSITKVDILKMDTEGAEYLILQGAKSFLSSHCIPIIFTEYNRQVITGYTHTLDDLEGILIENGYEIFEIQKKKLISFNSLLSTSSNLICIHKSVTRKIGVKLYCQI